MTAAVSLRLPARPENVAVVRQALTGLGDAYDLDPDLLGDVKTAVTEACNNVVLHAYEEDEEGSMEIDADSDGIGARVLVRDFGSGIQPRSIAVEERTLGLGLPLIATLSRSFNIRGRPELGLEVEMVFAPSDHDFDPLHDEREQRVNHPVDAPQAAEMLIQPGPLVAPVTSRVTAILAARADFPLDRLADAVLVSDAIAAHASEYISGRDVGVEISDDEGSLYFRIGPLDDGGAQGLLGEMEVPGLGQSLERLVDEVSVERGEGSVATERGDAEFLTLRIGKG
jgi:anti-sigma regulatory factor (Ser/Thr protein kinase)